MMDKQDCHCILSRETLMIIIFIAWVKMSKPERQASDKAMPTS